MIKITLRDPGMHDKTVEVACWEEVGPTLHKHDRNYTLAFVKEGDRPTKFYHRNLGERVWRNGSETL